MNQGSWFRNLAISGLLYSSGSRVPHYLSIFRELENASQEKIDEYQKKSLSALLSHAGKHVPYYAELFSKCGLLKNGVLDIKNFKKIPLLNKDIIIEQGNRMYADNLSDKNAFKNTSGGSTGCPVTIMQDRQYYDQNVVAAKIIYNEYFGKIAGEPEINLWGSERDVERGSLGFKENVINFLYNRKFLNAFSITEEDLHNFTQEINRHQPVSMWVYVESIDVLARYIEDESISIHSPRFIISTAGTLFPEIRERVERVFRCPVYNQYGSREIGAIAIDTLDRSGMRGFPYLNFVEIINDEIIVTCLTNYSMPLIRYQIGDSAEKYEGLDPGHGCEEKIMKSVTGRVISHFKALNGSLVHGQYLIHQFYFVDWVKKFQIVQEEADLVVCNIVVKSTPKTADLNRIEKNILNVMGAECRLRFNYIENIQPSPSGKYLYTICRV